MASSTVKRPIYPQSSQSFTRLDSPPQNSKSRASTLQTESTALGITSALTSSPLDDEGKALQDDPFEKESLANGKEPTPNDEEIASINERADDFDELPIELISLVDRFVESLSAKLYDTHHTVERLSIIFQDFYSKASGHIAIHVRALSTQQSRTASPSASISSKS